MSVEDPPLDEKPPEKLSPRTTPLYYLLACIFTLSIGTACFLAGKWSVDKAAVDRNGASFELYSVTTKPNQLSSREPIAPLATTEATTTETAEWIFAEIISTVAADPRSRQGNGAAGTTIAATTPTTEGATETTTMSGTTVTTDPTTLLSQTHTEAGLLTDGTTTLLPGGESTNAESTPTTEETTLMTSTMTATEEIDDRSNSASEIHEVTGTLPQMTTEDPTTTATVYWETTATTQASTVPNESGTTTTESITTESAITTGSDPDCLTSVERFEGVTDETTALPTTHNRLFPPGWLDDDETESPTTARTYTALPGLHWNHPWFRPGFHRRNPLPEADARRTAMKARKEVDDIVRMFQRFLQDTDRLFAF